MPFQRALERILELRRDAHTHLPVPGWHPIQVMLGHPQASLYSFLQMVIYPWEEGQPCQVTHIGNQHPVMYKENISFSFMLIDQYDMLKSRAVISRSMTRCQSAITYLIESSEVGSSVFVDILGLVSEYLAYEVVEDVRELPWDWELLNVLAGHLVPCEI